MNFSAKTVWITGASAGIGKAVAKLLAEKCNNLIISGRNEEALAQLADELLPNGLQVYAVPFDLQIPSTIEQAYKRVKAQGLLVDALIQFGGLSHRSLVLETETDVERKIMEVNYFGTVKLAKLVLKDMVKQNSGLLVATSSIVGKFGFPYRSSYSAAKHALHGYFETIRAENVAHNINVSVIIPGRVATEISKRALLKDGSEHGKMDQGLENGIAVDKAAKKIIRSLEKEKKEILVGGKELLMVHLRRWLPSLAYKMASKVNPT